MMQDDVRRKRNTANNVSIWVFFSRYRSPLNLDAMLPTLGGAARHIFWHKSYTRSGIRPPAVPWSNHLKYHLKYNVKYHEIPWACMSMSRSEIVWRSGTAYPSEWLAAYNEAQPSKISMDFSPNGRNLCFLSCLFKMPVLMFTCSARGCTQPTRRSLCTTCCWSRRSHPVFPARYLAASQRRDFWHHQMHKAKDMWILCGYYVDQSGPICRSMIYKLYVYVSNMDQPRHISPDGNADILLSHIFF